jgi:hypothetical protein
MGRQRLLYGMGGAGLAEGFKTMLKAENGAGHLRFFGFPGFSMVYRRLDY